jgi:hypothetical protein
LSIGLLDFATSDVEQRVVAVAKPNHVKRPVVILVMPFDLAVAVRPNLGASTTDKVPL